MTPKSYKNIMVSILQNFDFGKKIAKIAKSCLFYPYFKIFLKLKPGVAGSRRLAKNSTEGCLWSHKINMPSTIIIMQKLTELF